MSPLDALTLADFEPALGEVFTIPLQDAPALKLELVEATTFGTPNTPAPVPGAAPAAEDPAAGRPDAAQPPRDPFSLVFRGPLDPPLAQQTLRLAHPRLGELDVFVVPIARDEEAMRYQVVFG